MPPPIQFAYSDQFCALWTLNQQPKGKLHLHAVQVDGAHSKTAFAFTSSDAALQEQLDAYGPGLSAALASPDGVELEFKAASGGFFLTISNVLAGAQAVEIRIECWDPPVAEAHRCIVAAGQTRVRQVKYM